MHFPSNSSEDEVESEVAGEMNESEEDAEGAVWNGSMTGSQGAHHNILPSQMAAASQGTDSVADRQEATNRSGNQSKQVNTYSHSKLEIGLSIYRV